MDSTNNGSISITSDGHVFGQRYLKDESAVFAYNAWDNVEWTAEEEARVKAVVESHKSAAIDENCATRQTLRDEPHEKWNAFYSKHADRFFMDRKWVARELPELLDRVSKNKKLLLRICCETAKNRAYLERLLSCVGGQKLLKSEPVRSSHYLALALLYDLVVGKAAKRSKYNRHEKPYYEAMLAVQKIVMNDVEQLAQKGVSQTELAADSVSLRLPRYARLNTILLPVERAFPQLKQRGYTVQSLNADISPKEFRQRIADMDTMTILVDPHIQNLLIFRPGTDLHDFWMVNEGLLLQDKASCLASTLLVPKPKRSTQVMDVCAAPGMKTTHLAALMRNNGKIYAMDRDGNRTKTLRETLKKCGVKNADISHCDFLRVDPGDERFGEVSHVLVDPPCSGSGMVKRGEFLNEPKEPDERRLRSLANLQCMILKHALRFPALERCVYSTCSIYEAENENVIQEVLADEEVAANFELVPDPMPNWKHRGSSNFEFGPNCLRASPEEDLTNGFFVAVLRRKK